MPNIKLFPGKPICFAILCVLLITVATSAQTPTNDAYDNQQRARRLLEMDAEIKSLPDVEIRCQLRFNILEFIYSKDVRSEYAAAEPILIALFAEMAANEKRQGSRTKYLGNAMALLLRKHDPDTAKKIEATYVPKVDTSGEEYQSLREGASVGEVVDRSIERLLSANDRGSFLNVYETVRGKNTELGNRMLDAALKTGEKHPGPSSASLLNMLVDRVLNPPGPIVSPERMLRYYRILVRGAGIELAKPIPDGTSVATMWPLRRALPKIKVLDQRLYFDAQSIISKYRKSLSTDQIKKEEADDRIEAAEDQLERAVSEAESASTPALKDYLWNRASQIAQIKKNYRLSTDLLMKARPTLGRADQPKLRDQQLSALAYWAQTYREFEPARYAVDQIKDDQIRAKSLLVYAIESGRWNVNRPNAAQMADEAIAQIEKAGPTADVICSIGNSRSLMTQLTPFMNLQDFTARAVRIINQIPSKGADAKPGSPDRREFVTVSLRSMLLCSGFFFRPVWEASPVPDPEFANQIKVKEWRLAARIEAEKARRYFLPQ